MFLRLALTEVCEKTKKEAGVRVEVCAGVSARPSHTTQYKVHCGDWHSNGGSGTCFKSVLGSAFLEPPRSTRREQGSIERRERKKGSVAETCIKRKEKEVERLNMDKSTEGEQTWREKSPQCNHTSSLPQPHTSSPVQGLILGLMADSCGLYDSQQLGWWPHHYPVSIQTAFD